MREIDGSTDSPAKQILKEPLRELSQFSCFWTDSKFMGERVNGVHLTNAEKCKTRDRVEGKQP